MVTALHKGFRRDSPQHIVESYKRMADHLQVVLGLACNSLDVLNSRFIEAIRFLIKSLVNFCLKRHSLP